MDIEYGGLAQAGASATILGAHEAGSHTGSDSLTMRPPGW